MITHTKRYGVYHWDTFDNETFLLEEFDFLKNARKYIDKRFNVDSNGADKVDIVNKEGDVIESYSIR